MAERTIPYGTKTVWTHGINRLVGIAQQYDSEDDEYFLNVDGLLHAHLWVPADECVIAWAGK